jgi:hypothetical protein
MSRLLFVINGLGREKISHKAKYGFKTYFLSNSFYVLEQFRLKN